MRQRDRSSMSGSVSELPLARRQFRGRIPTSSWCSSPMSPTRMTRPGPRTRSSRRWPRRPGSGGPRMSSRRASASPSTRPTARMRRHCSRMPTRRRTGRRKPGATAVASQAPMRRGAILALAAAFLIGTGSSVGHRDGFPTQRSFRTDTLTVEPSLPIAGARKCAHFSSDQGTECVSLYSAVLIGRLHRSASGVARRWG